LRAQGRDCRRWLLLGRNARSAQIAMEALANPHFGIQIAAVVDAPAEPVADRGNGDPAAPFRRPPLAGLRQHDNLDVGFLRTTIIKEAIDEVVVALPVRRYYDTIEQVMVLCAEAGIPVKTPSRAFECIPDHQEIMHLGAVPLTTHYVGPVKALGLTAKRMLDIALALPMILLLLPVAALIAIAIKLTSRGPLLFTQTRIGLHSRPFRMIKFRTMVDGAADQQASLRPYNAADGPAFKMEHDPRITPVGRFLRRHHLDELPQLVHVLLGDMSLVGPRPLPASEANGSAWWQRRRLSMPPGLTCLWQVRGDHGMSFQEWMLLDLEYIDRWSLWLDVKVLAHTVTAVIRGRGW
jgi:exopolysaccharide biosynthesis polyprenyl glycosylphosphotransferase